METEEVWKDVRGYEGLYQVSNLGRVKSLSRTVELRIGFYRGVNERILKPVMLRGYPACRLCKKGSGGLVKIHKLVAFAFIEHPIASENKNIIDHINGNKTDNRSINLRFVTSRYNVSEGFRKDSTVFSSQHTGVCWHKARGKWEAGIGMSGKTKYLGLFINELDAAAAYQKALKAFKL